MSNSIITNCPTSRIKMAQLTKQSELAAVGLSKLEYFHISRYLGGSSRSNPGRFSRPSNRLYWPNNRDWQHKLTPSPARAEKLYHG